MNDNCAKTQVFFVLGNSAADEHTQCQKIAKEFNLIHISIDNLVQQEMDSRSSNAQLIKNHIQQNKAIPSEITINLIQSAINHNIKQGHSNFLIDGFPQNKENLKAWNKQMENSAEIPFLLYLKHSNTNIQNSILQQPNSSQKTLQTFNNDIQPIIDEFTKLNKCKIIKPTDDTYIEQIRPLFNSYLTKPSSSSNNPQYFGIKASSIRLLNGFSIGLGVTFLLNPWDKALYLSILHNRSFLDLRNFHAPFQGVGQSLISRAISRGLYFPFEQFGYIWSKQYIFKSNDNMNYMVGGTFAGICNAFLLNPVSAIKYTRWSDLENLSLRKEFISMYKKGGYRQFMKGMYATMCRDIVFGSTFALMRFGRRARWDDGDGKTMGYGERLWIDGSSAIVATIMSSPFNFVRNMQYGTPKDVIKIPGMMEVLRELYVTGRREGGVIDASKYWVYRLRIGWGSMRVAVGMSITASCYEVSQKYILDD